MFDSFNMVLESGAVVMRVACPSLSVIPGVVSGSESGAL